jgi:hypothetical protein
MSDAPSPQWPDKPFNIERVDGFGNLPAVPQDQLNDVAQIGTRSPVEHNIVVDKSDPESLGEAVFTLLVRGETDARVIGRTLGIPAMQVRALILQAKRKFTEAAVEVATDPDARRMALSAQMQEIGRMALSEAMFQEGTLKAKFLGLALRVIVEQSKVEGLTTQRVEVTEHTIDEKRGTITVTQRIQDDLSRFGLDKDAALFIGRAAVSKISDQLEKKMKANEDVIDVEVTDDPPNP